MFCQKCGLQLNTESPYTHYCKDCIKVKQKEAQKRTVLKMIVKLRCKDD